MSPAPEVNTLIASVMMHWVSISLGFVLCICLSPSLMFLVLLLGVIALVLAIRWDRRWELSANYPACVRDHG